MNERAIHTEGARFMVPDSGAVVWAGPSRLRRALRYGPESGADPGGFRPDLPKDGDQWRKRLVTYCRSHKLRLYCVAVTTTTLAVLLLQVFAGVHK